MDYKATAVNANEGTKVPYTPQGWEGNSPMKDSMCAECGEKGCSC